jgi:hypothetical protein
VSGREVAQHGLPHHDSLTLWTLGARWIDQQWLGQLFYYGLARRGESAQCVEAGLLAGHRLHAVVRTPQIVVLASEPRRGASGG